MTNQFKDFVASELNELESNARLIAAAPEMLEDLLELVLELRARDKRAQTTEEKLTWAELSILSRAEKTIEKARGEK